MNKILLINGSPNKLRSNTRVLVKAFLDGLNREKKFEIDEIICADMHLESCRGCFTCWRTQSGICVIKDDMNDAIKKYLNANIIIWSFPNHFFSMPSIAKNFLDRLLPLNLPKLEMIEDGRTIHPKRFHMKAENIFLFCTSGFYNKEANMEPISAQFDLLYHGKCKMIFCTQGQLMQVKYLKHKTSKYLHILYQAGVEFDQTSSLSEEMLKKMNTPYMDLDSYVELANRHWVVKDESMSAGDLERQKFLTFMNCMPFAYEPEDLKVDKAVLELYVKDFDYTCQMILDKKKCILVEDASIFELYDLRVVTTFALLANGSEKNIGKGKETEKCGENSCFYSFAMLLNRLKQMNTRKEIYMG